MCSQKIRCVVLLLFALGFVQLCVGVLRGGHVIPGINDCGVHQCAVYIVINIHCFCFLEVFAWCQQQRTKKWLVEMSRHYHNVRGIRLTTQLGAYV